MTETPGRDWNATAEGWRKWHAISERAARPVTETMLDMAGIEAGYRVLDLAAGLGDSAAAAARRVGPGGSVLVTDGAERMLDGARAALAEEGLANVRFRLADLDALDVGETGFDAAICRWGLMFVSDLQVTLPRVRELLRPGACFAAVVWGDPANCPVQSLANRVVMETLDLPPVGAGPGTPFALSDRPALEEAFASAGFSAVDSRTVTVTYEFGNAEEYARYRRERSSLDGRVGHLPEADRERAWAAVVAEARKLARPDRSLRFVNEAVVVAGQNAVQQYF